MNTRAFTYQPLATSSKKDRDAYSWLHMYLIELSKHYCHDEYTMLACTYCHHPFLFHTMADLSFGMVIDTQSVFQTGACS